MAVALSLVKVILESSCTGGQWGQRCPLTSSDDRACALLLTCR